MKASEAGLSYRFPQASVARMPGRSRPSATSDANRTSGCQDGHMTRTAKMDRRDVNNKGGPKRRQQLIRRAGSVVGDLRS
ncbi:hypothetical protein ElyMa_000555500 [Elysia marginata]|uniref:Uncharacterized protein n=1 Tax=Elysia marginata TaxID=1093978 RepID=A0AAV4G2F1_9GAST|nr:hypothetical protein ElyMa_000555500 [Elysia marginata]